MKFKSPFNGGIQINNYIISLTSNKNRQNEEEEIIFYNIDSQNKKIKTIEGYSFVTCHNNLALLPKSDENNKYLVCACKKNKENQVNSILLIKLELENNNIINIITKFNDEDNDNFEIYCFCPLNAENNIIKNTDLFLVGGFNKKNNKGLIKLYKLISNNEGISIKCIPVRPISNQINNKIISIIQSKTDGKIIITYDNGKSKSISIRQVVFRSNWGF